MLAAAAFSSRGFERERRALQEGAPPSSIPWSATRKLDLEGFSGHTATPPRWRQERARLQLRAWLPGDDARGGVHRDLRRRRVLGHRADSHQRPGQSCRDQARAGALRRQGSPRAAAAEGLCRAESCPRTDAQLDRLAQPLIDAEARAQRRLDIETQNGELEARLIEWERQIEKDLASLDRFRAKTGPAGGDRRDTKKRLFVTSAPAR